MIKRLLRISLLALAAFLGGLGIAVALDVTGAFYQTSVITNNTGVSRTNFAADISISGATLIDDGFMAADTLNGVIHQATVEIPSMPPTNRIVIEGMVLQDGALFTAFTTEAQNATTLDTPLLPVTVDVNDALYGGCDNPCRIITINQGQAGIGDWVLAWEYWNGTAFTSFGTGTAVVDDTNAFRTSGSNKTVTVTMPLDWATSAVTGSGVTSYWWRARVTTGDATTVQPIANQVHYENGQWWTWVGSLASGADIGYTMSLGGPAMVDRHQIFTGNAGITTVDHATVEPGSIYIVHWEGMVAFSTGSAVACLACKGTAPGSPFRLFVSNASTRQVSVTATATGSATTLDLIFPVPPTVADADGVSVSIDVISTSTDLILSAEGVGEVRGTPRTITNTADGWTWSSGGAAIYADEMAIATAISVSRMTDSLPDWQTYTMNNVTGAAPGLIKLKLQ